jgi:hypothetical protein
MTPRMSTPHNVPMAPPPPPPMIPPPMTTPAAPAGLAHEINSPLEIVYNYLSARNLEGSGCRFDIRLPESEAEEEA